MSPPELVVTGIGAVSTAAYFVWIRWVSVRSRHEHIPPPKSVSEEYITIDSEHPGLL